MKTTRSKKPRLEDDGADPNRVILPVQFAEEKAGVVELYFVRTNGGVRRNLDFDWKWALLKTRRLSGPDKTRHLR